MWHSTMVLAHDRPHPAPVQMDRDGILVKKPVKIFVRPGKGPSARNVAVVVTTIFLPVWDP